MATEPFRLDRPRFDQSTYGGRVRHFLDVIDPRTLLQDGRIPEAQRLLERYRREGSLPGAAFDPAELWAAKKIVDASVHPETHRPIVPFFRMSAFVPMNVPLVFGMLNSTSVAGQVFWQVANQSYNAAVNVANGSASAPTDRAQLATAFTAAVGTAVGMSVGLGKVVENAGRLGPSAAGLVRALVPFVAVASAGATNCYLMRRSETEAGVPVSDAEGRVVGKSQVAGKKAVFQSVLTRVALPAPVLALPPLLMSGIERLSPAVAGNPRARMLAQMTVITSCLFVALPCSIGLFPQTASVPAAELEPAFHHLVDSKGQPVRTLYFNKGL